MRTILNIILITLLQLLFITTVSAHPGNTASDGCHYCRTRCDYWGVPWNARHCHGGYTPPVYTQPTSIPLPTSTPRPTNTPTPNPTNTPTPKPTVTSSPELQGTTSSNEQPMAVASNSDSPSAAGLTLMGLSLALGYYGYKKLRGLTKKKISS